MYVGDQNSEHIVTYRRGLPRRIGNEVATGDLVCYFDTDDIMLPNRLGDIHKAWKDKPDEVKWSSNPYRIMHMTKWNVPKDPKLLNEELKKREKVQISLKKYGIYEPFYVEISVPNGHISAASCALVHKRQIQAKWEDCELVTTIDGKRISGFTEDHKFLKNMIKLDDKNGFRQQSICTVVCHYRNLWDV